MQYKARHYIQMLSFSIIQFLLLDVLYKAKCGWKKKFILDQCNAMQSQTLHFDI